MHLVQEISFTLPPSLCLSFVTLYHPKSIHNVSPYLSNSLSLFFSLSPSPPLIFLFPSTLLSPSLSTLSLPLSLSLHFSLFMYFFLPTSPSLQLHLSSSPSPLCHVLSLFLPICHILSHITLSPPLSLRPPTLSLSPSLSLLSFSPCSFNLSFLVSLSHHKIYTLSIHLSLVTPSLSLHFSLFIS